MMEPGLAVLILFTGSRSAACPGCSGSAADRHGACASVPASAFGFHALDMRQVAGLTITQGLFACLSGPGVTTGTDP
jgi:hypothetical protein